MFDTLRGSWMFHIIEGLEYKEGETEIARRAVPNMLLVYCISCCIWMYKVKGSINFPATIVIVIAVIFSCFIELLLFFCPNLLFYMIFFSLSLIYMHFRYFLLFIFLCWQDTHRKEQIDRQTDRQLKSTKGAWKGRGESSESRASFLIVPTPFSFLFSSFSPCPDLSFLLPFSSHPASVVFACICIRVCVCVCVCVW